MGIAIFSALTIISLIATLVHLNYDGYEESLTGGPLFLTPLLREGHPSKARERSRVRPLFPGDDLDSFAGYLTVEEKYESNLYFWFFPAADDPSSKPLTVYLAGGPGGSSVGNVFTKLGPYMLKDTGQVEHNPDSLLDVTSLLFIDNPVGAGFSFTALDEGYPRNQTKIDDHLLEAMKQFYELFSEYKSNELYLLGDSYAGKYVPSFAHRIHTLRDSLHWSLRGILICCGWTDPENQIPISHFYYNLGLISYQTYQYIKWKENLATNLTKQGRYLESLITVDDVHFGIFYGPSTLIERSTGLPSLRTPLDNEIVQDPYDAIASVETRRSAHIGHVNLRHGDELISHLADDIYKGVKEELAVLMDNYKVTYLSGQFDLKIAYPSLSRLLRSINWKLAEEFRAARRIIWRLRPNADVAGYVRQVGNFTDILVRNAGHEVVSEQFDVFKELFMKFLSGAHFSEG